MIDNNLNEIPTESADPRSDMTMASPSGLASTTVMTDEGATLASYSNIAESHLVIRDQGIADFLAKPYLYVAGNFSTADTSNSVLQSFSPIDAIVTNSYFSNKKQGYRLVRGTAIIRIQFSANPFQQGLYLMHFLPSEQLRTTILVDSTYVSSHNATIAGKSQQPHVYVDLRDSAVEIEIPYVSPYEFADIGNSATDWGTLFLSCISPLLTGAAGETTVPYTIWVSFKDWEMTAPCVPQGPAAKKVKSKRIAASEKEEVPNNISGSLSLASKVASSLSGIPIIGDLAGSTSWMLRGASGIASFFGYSKPNERPNMVLGNTNSGGNYYLANSTGKTLAPSLALDCDNSLRLLSDCSVTDEDEMSFSFLKKIPSIVKSFEWSYGDGVGQLLWTAEVMPKAFGVVGTKTSGAVTAAYIQYPPFAYLATQFNLWRGSIVLNFKFVKTQFAKGKLMIVYTPIPNESGVPITSPTVYTSNVSLRQIIDISQGDEFTITLPYILEQNYCGANEYMGQLDVFVVNQLRVPETCANYMEVVVSAHAGDDFELASPMPYGNCTPFSPQIGEDISNEGVGSYPIQSMDLKPSSQSVGEVFTSVRQLLLRSTPIRSIAGYSSSTAYYLWPWYTTMTFLSAGALTSGDMGGDSYNMIAQMYSFYRGGIRIGALCSSAFKGSAALIDGYGFYGNSNLTANTAIQGAVNWRSQAVFSKTGAVCIGAGNDQSGVSMFEMPYYCKTRCSPVTNYSVMSTAQYIATLVAQPVDLLNLNTQTAVAANSIAFLRSVKEDFQFTYFVGCPPILVGDPA